MMKNGYMTKAEFDTLGFDVNAENNFLESYDCETVAYYDVISDILENEYNFQTYVKENPVDTIFKKNKYIMNSYVSIDVDFESMVNSDPTDTYSYTAETDFYIECIRKDNTVNFVLTCDFKVDKTGDRDMEIICTEKKLIKSITGNTEKELYNNVSQWFNLFLK